MTGQIALVAILCFLLLVAAAGIGLAGIRTKREERMNNRLRALRGLLSDTDLENGAVLSIVARPTQPKGNPVVRFLWSVMQYNPREQTSGIASWTPVFLMAALFSMVVSYGVAHLLGTLGLLSAPVFFVLFVRLYANNRRNRLHQLLFEQFPDSLNIMVRGLKVGVPLVQSITNVGETAEEPTRAHFMSVVRKLNIGIALNDALEEMAAQNPLPEYKFFAVALALQSRTGGNISETLDNLASTIRKRVAAKKKGNALIAEAKMSMYILAFIPFPLVLTLLVINYQYISVLFTTHSGGMILLAGMTSWSMGMLSMKFLIRRALT